MTTSFTGTTRKALLLAGIALSTVISSASFAQEAAFSAAQKDEIKTVIKDYLMENPEIIAEAMNELQAKQQREMEAQAAAKLVEYKDFFKTADLPYAGNKDGDVTVIEFFDYNCGYCKKAFSDVQALLNTDDNVKVIFMEMPILSQQSMTAAKYALAAHKQGKYFEFHKALMEYQGSKDKATLKRLATEVGLDADQLEKDAQDPALKDTITENVSIAQDIGIRGTPGFIVGDQLFRGYIGEEALIGSVKAQRG